MKGAYYSSTRFVLILFAISLVVLTCFDKITGDQMYQIATLVFGYYFGKNINELEQENKLTSLKNNLK